MEIIYLNQHSDIPKDPTSCVLALGFFDGIHIGHRKVINKAKKIAEQENLKLAILTLFPHPKQIINPKTNNISYLTSPSLKNRLFASLGVDIIYIINFNKDIAKMKPKKFIQEYVNSLNVKHVVAGFDYTYGYKASGNMNTIKDDGKNKFKVTTVPKFEYQNEKVSSTSIKKLLSKGYVESAFQQLNRYHQTIGYVKSILIKDNLNKIMELTISHYPFNEVPKCGFYEIKLILNKSIYIGTLLQKTEFNRICKVRIESPGLMRCVNIKDKVVNILWLSYVSKETTLTSNGYKVNI